jgi:3'(2'), 5'-bisphosphate nucleotidase/inositol polyphosphate 1-phosphatase
MRSWVAGYRGDSERWSLTGPRGGGTQRVQRQLGGDEQQNKDDDSPVTVADYGAQAVVAWCLLRAFPAAFSMVAEEDSAALMGDANRALRERIAALVTEVVREEDPSVTLSVEQVIALIDTGKAAGGAAGRHWVLDPIDGTRGFVGGRQYAVCLGLIDGGEVVVGVLGCPNMPLAALTDADGTAAVTSAGGGNNSILNVTFTAF